MTQLSLLHRVPTDHPADGRVFVDILVNVALQLDGAVGKIVLSQGYPFTVHVSRTRTDFKHGCWSLEAAMEFADKHLLGLRNVSPPGKVRVYYNHHREGREPIRYFACGFIESRDGGVHWRAEEERGLWFTPEHAARFIQEQAVDTRPRLGCFGTDRTDMHTHEVL